VLSFIFEYNRGTIGLLVLSKPPTWFLYTLETFLNLLLPVFFIFIFLNFLFLFIFFFLVLKEKDDFRRNLKLSYDSNHETKSSSVDLIVEVCSIVWGEIGVDDEG
jgi:hypothetical protein